MEIAQRKKHSLAQEAHSKLKARRLFLILVLLLAFSAFQLSVFLSGCLSLRGSLQNGNILLAISTGNLKGMDKVDVIKQFGHPVATSKSEISECWYYARPRSVWLWFKSNKVDHWEVE